jgi:hypothetical protein
VENGETGSGLEIIFFEGSKKIKSILNFGFELMANGVVTRSILLGTSKGRIS